MTSRRRTAAGPAPRLRRPPMPQAPLRRTMYKYPFAVFVPSLMFTDVFDSCRKILKFAPQAQVDEHAEKRLKQLIDQNEQDSGKDDLGNVTVLVNGKVYPNIYEAIAEVPEPKELEFVFEDCRHEHSWLFNPITTCMKVFPDGVGWVHIYTEVEKPEGVAAPPAAEGSQPDSPPLPPGPECGDHVKENKRAMFRASIVRHFRPQSFKSELSDQSEQIETIPFGLARIEQLWARVRAEGVIPVQMRICAYTQDTRYAYSLDLLRNRLLIDQREGKIPAVNHLKRPGILFFHLDKILAMKDLPPQPKQILEVIFESKDMDMNELKAMFNMTEKQLGMYMMALTSRGFVSVAGKPPQEKYLANIEAMSKVQ